MIRETSRDDSETRMWDAKTSNLDEWKDVMIRNYWSLLVQLSCFFVEFLWFAVNFLWDLSVSLFLCVKVDFGCSHFVVQNWRILPQNGNLVGKMSSWIEESFFPAQMTWIVVQWWSFAQTLGYSVFSSVHLCLSSSVQDTTAEGVLSLCWCSRTLTLTTSIGIRYGCYEILIPCSTAVLLSTIFLLISISPVEDEGQFI